MNVCMIAYTFYEHDNRVRRYAESLAQFGHSVDVIALKSPKGDSFTTLKNVSVYKIQERELNEKGKLSYLFRTLKFFISSFMFVTRKHLKRPYEIIHVHSVPDFEIFAALVPKLMGAKIILDIHDIVPEFFSSKFNYSTKSLLYRTLVFVEKISCRFSDHVIISNHLWYKKLVRRSSRPSKCSVYLNYPDTNIFRRAAASCREKDNGEVVLMYPGTLNWHQGLDLAIKAFAQIYKEVPYARFVIYGRGSSESVLQEMIRDYGLNGRVFIEDPVPLEQIARIMSKADIGIVPKRNNGFGGEAFSTKTLEFMAMKIPIIVSRTTIDDYYFNDQVVTFFEPENIIDLASKMKKLIESKELRQSQAKKALGFMDDYKWDHNRQKYFDLIEQLLIKK